MITKDNANEHIEKIGCFISETVKKAGMTGVVLGMSGGIDCSVVARLCQTAGVDALLLMLPDGDSMSIANSRVDSLKLIEKFGFFYREIDISHICASIEATVPGLTAVSKINIRPRVRMTILYAQAQTDNRLVIGTGNLCERTVGYFTKWGDGGYDLNPIAFLTKTEIRTLAHALDIPESIINKPPSAGLYEGQTDEADLGVTYDELDKYLLYGTSGDAGIDVKIEKMKKNTEHKHKGELYGQN